MAPRGSGIVINIGANGAEAKAVLAMVQQQLRETGAAGKEAGLDISSAMESMKASVSGAVGAVLPVAMIAEATSKIKELIGATIDYGMEIGHASQGTGISAQNMSVLKYASDVTGVSFEALTKGMGRMSKAMLEAEEGKKASIQSFGLLGISQQQVQQHSNDMLGMLGLVADRFQALPDGPNKAGVAMTLFSRAGMGMIPFLNQGSEGIARLAGEAHSLGLVLDQEGIEKLEAMHHAAEMMKGSIEGAELGIATGLSPAVVTLGNALAAAMGRADGWNALGTKMGEIALNLASSLGYLIKFLQQAGAEYDSLDSHINHFFDAIDAKIGFTAAQRDRASAALKQDIAESQKAEYAYHEAETNYFRLLTNLATDPEKPKPKPKATGSVNLQDLSGGGKSGNRIDSAETSLAQAQTEAIAKITKDADNVALAANEAWHKLMLESDSEYYAEKLRLEIQSIDAQETAIKSRKGELQALLSTQQGDKSLKRNSNGVSAEELKTKQEMVGLDTQLNELESKRQELQINDSARAQLQVEEQKLATLKIAAQIEEGTNTSISARLALMQEENRLELQRVANSAGTSSELYKQTQALEAQKEKILQINELQRQIDESMETNKLRTGVLKTQEDQDPRQKKLATAQINADNAQEAASLAALAAQYDALAASIGGPYLEAAKKLHAEIAQLNTPNQHSSADLSKELGDGITSMAEKIGEASLKGKNSFHDMATSIEKDVVDLAIKLAMNQWLKPLLNGMFSGSSGGGSSAGGAGDISPGNFPGFADGGDPTGPSIVGEEGPELFFPKGPGTVMPSTMLSQIADGGGGKAPNTTLNITNASSQPVTARQTGSSFDSDTKSYVTHFILEDLQQGGPISSALRPGG